MTGSESLRSLLDRARNKMMSIQFGAYKRTCYTTRPIKLHSGLSLFWGQILQHPPPKKKKKKKKGFSRIYLFKKERNNNNKKKHLKKKESKEERQKDSEQIVHFLKEDRDLVNYLLHPHLPSPFHFRRFLPILQREEKLARIGPFVA